MPSLSKSLQLVRNMGGRYVRFRVMHELKVRTGIFKNKFPQNPEYQSFISLNDWRKNAVRFFVDGRLPYNEEKELSKVTEDFKNLQAGKFSFFSSLNFNLGKNYDWVTNPDTNYKYNAQTHWSQINDFNKEAGDIKYVWEKSRFSFLYTVMRQDARTGEDHAAWVWQEILSWIAANPINSGPNYKCSQEISLRVLNWTFALNFYKYSESLTEDIFGKIMFNIYWQLNHVYDNISFSRIAVRNNHAITETLALYLGGILYPFFPEAAKWKSNGKKWFEEEIAYQIYPDGTFLQFSMNYHRVVIQLLTWAIQLAKLNKESFSAVVYDRANKSLQYLTDCLDTNTGWLPNYGANDGALFFKLNDAHYRDYRPQLEALAYALDLNWKYGTYEDVSWYGLSKPKSNTATISATKGSSKFEQGGYYLYRQDNSLTFIRCGNHKDRPSQADNLHLDIWHNNTNLLHDAGSYKYNTGETDLKYFMGTRSHNTVMLDDYDQMEKGARFIWYHWSQCEEVVTEETADYFSFEGTIKAFQQVNPAIRHYRKVKINKNAAVWEVEDRIINKPAEMLMHQLWHTCYPEKINFEAQLADKSGLPVNSREGYYSSFYGKKDKCTELVFSTKENYIKSFISVR